METVHPINPPETNQTEAQKIWQEYLQRCCEIGQLMMAEDEIPEKITFAKNKAKEKLLSYTKRMSKQSPQPNGEVK